MLRSFNIDLKNDEITDILRYMSHISKNIYNSSIFCINVYRTYKKLIYTTINNMANKNLLTSQDINKKISNIYFYYYTLETTCNIHKNIKKFIYDKLKEEIYDKKIIIDNFNYDKITNYILSLFPLNITNDDMYKHLIIEKLRTYYFYNYYFVKRNITNNTLDKIKNIYSDSFISEVSKDNNLFLNEIDIKKNNKFYNAISSDQNLISTFIYNNLNSESKKLNSDIIQQIINKVFSSFNSYYALREKGFYTNKPNYLKKDSYFILHYHDRIFKLENNKIRLSIGNFISRKYEQKLKSKNLVKICNKTFCDLKLMKKIEKGVKISEKDNYIYNNYYIEKNNKNIIKSDYINIGEYIASHSLINVQVVPKDENGNFFKLCIIYDKTGNIITKRTNRKIKLTDIEKEQNKIERNRIKKERKTKLIVDENKELSQDNTISIDLGMKNLMTIYNPNGKQKIIKGGIIKSINYYYNKKIDNIKSTGKIQMKQKINDKDKQIIYKKLNEEERKIIINKLYNKKENKINDYFNKIVKYIDKEYQKKDIIIGYNYKWKQRVNMGKKNNRDMYEIPFMKIINKMKDKYGDRLYITEESYTSKCDSLMYEELKYHETYSGSRKKRGMFISGNKKIINADINGAINIMRKKINNLIIDESKIMNPEIIRIKL